MHRKFGFTLMEMMIVLIIIGVVIAIAFPNFETPTEQARALTAQNNLMAIYTAQKNYFNNWGAYIVGSGNAFNIAQINNSLNLSIQDDSTYSYECTQNGSGYQCVACRNFPGTCINGSGVLSWNGSTGTVLKWVLTNSAPISSLNQSTAATANPRCYYIPGYSNWCP